MVADIAPHEKARKGEDCEVHVLYDVPALHVDHAVAHRGDDVRNAEILHRIQPAQVDVELLFEKFQKSGIEL